MAWPAAAAWPWFPPPRHADQGRGPAAGHAPAARNPAGGEVTNAVPGLSR